MNGTAGSRQLMRAAGGDVSGLLDTGRNGIAGFNGFTGINTGLPEQQAVSRQTRHSG